jgi:hypothetical protein
MDRGRVLTGTPASATVRLRWGSSGTEAGPGRKTGSCFAMGLVFDGPQGFNIGKREFLDGT